MFDFNPRRPFSRLKMPPRAQFDQPQQTYLALEFHKRRGTGSFLSQLLDDFAAQFHLLYIIVTSRTKNPTFEILENLSGNDSILEVTVG